MVEEVGRAAKVPWFEDNVLLNSVNSVFLQSTVMFHHSALPYPVFHWLIKYSTMYYFPAIFGGSIRKATRLEFGIIIVSVMPPDVEDGSMHLRIGR